METREAILNLLDSFWFELNIMKKNTSSSTTSTTSEDNLKKESSEEPKLTRIRTIHTRSMSDQLSITSFNNDSLSPDSVLITSKLQTILSGKEVTDSEEHVNPKPEKVQLLPKKKNISSKGRKKRESKSLSDLEFEELKGFMDLGFVFSEEDKDSSLASIIPGLQRLGNKDEEQEKDVYDDDEEEEEEEFVVQRPYLSEAWEVHEKKKKENPLMNWKVPTIYNEIDMKNNLRLWAHTVASTVHAS